MPAKIVNLCEAIKDYLNGLTLSQAFTAIRANKWYSDLEDTNGLQVVVLPVEKTVEPIDRGSVQRTFVVGVVTQQANVTTRDDEDDLLLFIEELTDALYSRDFAGFGFQGFTDVGEEFIETDASVDSLTVRSLLQLTYIGE